MRVQFVVDGNKRTVVNVRRYQNDPTRTCEHTCVTSNADDVSVGVAVAKRDGRAFVLKRSTKQNTGTRVQFDKRGRVRRKNNKYNVNNIRCKTYRYD